MDPTCFSCRVDMRVLEGEGSVSRTLPRVSAPDSKTKTTQNEVEREQLGDPCFSAQPWCPDGHCHALPGVLEHRAGVASHVCLIYKTWVLSLQSNPAIGIQLHCGCSQTRDGCLAEILVNVQYT